MEIIERIPLRNIAYLDSILPNLKSFLELCKNYEDVEEEFSFLADGRMTKDEERKNQYNKIKTFCKSMMASKGSMVRKYAYSANATTGRLFCGASIQAVWKPFRGLLMKHTTDIDMKNAHPVILSYICKKYDIPCPQLNDYIVRRDAILGEFQNRDSGKRLFLKAINKEDATKHTNTTFRKFDKEIHEIQRRIVAIPEFKEYVDAVPSTKVYNRIGSAINRILCDYENKILQVIVLHLKEKNIEACALMFDGLMVYGNYYDDESLLVNIEEAIEEEFPEMDMKLSYKEHDDSIEIPEEFEFEEEEEIPEVEGVYSDMEAAEKVYKLYPHWVNCDDTLYVFNENTGMWESNVTAYYSVLRKFSDKLHSLGTEKSGKSYGNTEALMKRIPGLIKILCINNNWLKQSRRTSLGKILFNNGYYDFHTGTFYRKETVGFNPAIVFMGKIHRDFIVPTEEDIKYMNDIENRLFHQSLGRDVGNYFILNLARGLAGDMMKRMLFGLGVSNSGKGVLTNACMLSLGDYCGSFDAGNLAHKNSMQDGGQIMRWAMLLSYKRIIFSNEMKSTCDLDGNYIKKISSGGDPLIGRTHGQCETEFITHFLPVVLANDLPKIKPYDDAVDTRVRVINFSKSYVDNPQNEFELKKDDRVNEELTTDRFQRNFINILIRKYMQYMASGKVEVEPANVKEAKKDWVEESSSCVDVFVKDFEITNDATHFIRSSEIETWITSTKLGITMKKFSLEMKRYAEINKLVNLKSFDKKISGKTCKCWSGIRIPLDEVEEEL